MKKMMMPVMKIKTNRGVAFKKYVMPVKRLVRVNRNIIHSDKKSGCHKECHKECFKGNGKFSFAERGCIHDNDRNGTEIICEQKNSTKRTRKIKKEKMH